MAIKCYERTWSPELQDHIRKFVADFKEDVPNLPKSAPMSQAFVVEDGSVHVVNASGEWKEV